MVLGIVFQDEWGWLDIIFTLLIFSSCLCAPITRVITDRQRRRMALYNQQVNQQGREGGAPQQYERVPTMPSDGGSNLQAWEERFLTTTDLRQKIDALQRLAKLGTKDTMEMLSENAETERHPEVLAAIESAMAQIDHRLSGNENRPSVTFT